MKLYLLYPPVPPISSNYILKNSDFRSSYVGVLRGGAGVVVSSFWPLHPNWCIHQLTWQRRSDDKKQQEATSNTGWWFQPIWKILVKLFTTQRKRTISLATPAPSESRDTQNISQVGNLPQVGVKIKKMKPPSRTTPVFGRHVFGVQSYRISVSVALDI